MTKKELIEEMTKLAKNYGNQKCDDRYDEGYQDAMYDAIYMVKDLMENDND